MESFKSYRANKETEQLDEVLITFGNKAYPKFNNVVIMAGGAGSGKGFVQKKLLGIEGLTFDVDHLKTLAMQSVVFASKVKSETGTDLKSLDLANPDNVSIIHEILSGLYSVDKKFQDRVFKSIATAHPDRKPNLIFDVTLKDIAKLDKINKAISTLGYKKEDVHIVWVVNDIKVALKQNLDPSRGRVVPQEILIQTHEGVAMTMKKLLDMGSSIKKYMNGDVWLAFNKAGVDTDLRASKRGGEWVEKANVLKVKDRGKNITTSNKLKDDIFNKISNYTPKINTWIKKNIVKK